MESNPFAEAAAALSGPTPKEINQAILLQASTDRLNAAEGDLRSLRDLVKAKNDKILKLETENVRLKMQRTDTELATQVYGLRTEVGKKDAALVAYRRQLDTFIENEKIILRRVASAEAKVTTVQETLVRMQRSRDAAQLETEAHERDRLEAVTAMVAASDRARKLEERLAEIEKKGKPMIAANQNSLKAKAR